ncbi:MAG: polysaccharide deacetylase family protein [Actinomycetales bacterium]|nr:polysaccharide deacetylase family protein [Actinomycetales bacterium]
MKTKGVVLSTLAAVVLAVAPGVAAFGGPASGSDPLTPLRAAPGVVAAADTLAGSVGISVNELAYTGTALTAVTAAVPPAVPAATKARLAGLDRYGTSVSLSKWTFKNPGDAQRVYLARADVFDDALTAGVLTDGPILLVPGACGNPPAVVRAEVDRLDPPMVVALGGDQAVCESQLEVAANGRATDRLAGADRAGTAAAIGLYQFSGGASTVYLARGNSSPDAMVGGVLTDGPILLLNSAGNHVPQVTRDAIAALDPDRVIALGGTTAVSTSRLLEAADGRETGRLAGSTRYGTSVEVAQRAFPSGSARVYIARGDGSNLADAVASGVLTDGPVLLVNGPCVRVPDVVRDYLADTQPDRVVALGGLSAVCTQLLDDAVAAATPPPPPPPGPDCDVVKCVALTFDDGPSAYTSQLVDTLDALDVPATFFVLGQQSNSRPNTVRRTFDHGYQVENHSWDHPQMTTLTLAQQRSQFTSTRDLLTSLGIAPTDMLRPPYGAWNSNTRNLGVPLILWSIDTRDWESQNTEQIRTHVRTHIHNGAIVLQHDTISQSVAAVPGIVADLRARDYHFVTVEDLVPWAGPGDLVYSRGQVIDASVEAVPEVFDGAEYVPPLDAAELPQG